MILRQFAGWLKSSVIMLVLILPVGCAGVGVVETNDPIKKVSQAKTMVSHGRPLMALRLMDGAVELCNTKLDKSCLADVYLNYAFILNYSSVKNAYRQYAFRAPETQMLSKDELPIYYLDKSIDLYQELGDFVSLWGGYIYKIQLYGKLKNTSKACEALEKANDIWANNIPDKEKEGIILTSPDGSEEEDFQDFYHNMQEEFGCNTR